MLFGSGISQVALVETDNRVLAYPNPCVDVVSLKLPAEGGTHWTMMNASGQFIRSGFSNQSLLRLSTTDLPAGIYYLRGANDQNSWSTMVTKRD